MEWELRIIFAVVGILIIGYAAYDVWRRAQKNRRQTIELPPVPDLDYRDQEGFDRDGISQVRTSGDASELSDNESSGEKPVAISEPMVATKDDRFVADESDTLSTQDIDADSTAEPELIFSMALLAGEDQPFQGAALLQALVENGCRYGDMDIFHRCQSAQSPNKKYFSVANAFNPGTFDINHMESETFNGLTFFMTIPGSYEPETAHQTMVETARKLQEALSGRLVDSSRSVYTEQTFQHEVEQIKEYKRRLLAKA